MEFPNQSRAIITLVLGLFVSACSGSLGSLPDYDIATAHFRETERFQNVQIRFSGEIVGDRLTAALPDALRDYLRRNGIDARLSSENPEPEGAVVLDLALTQVTNIAKRTMEPNGPLAPQMQRLFKFSGFGGVLYQYEARLIGSDGQLIEQTSLLHRSGEGEPEIEAQLLAEMIIDDMLLIWHPAPEVLTVVRTSATPAEFTLLSGGAGVSPVTGRATDFEWESFPNPRLLAGSDIAPGRITDVSYEFRMQVSDGFSRSSYDPNIRTYQVRGLHDPWHELPFTLPACESLRWSSRAHFSLDGNPRVTEWSGVYSTKGSWRGFALPPYAARRAGIEQAALVSARSGPWQHRASGGTLMRLDAPPGLKCSKLQKSRETILSRLELEPIKPGQTIGTLALVSRQCMEECGERVSVAEASRDLHKCVADRFRREGIEASVVDLSTLLDELPFPPDRESEGDAATKALAAALSRPENREFLKKRGLRYVVTTEMMLSFAGANTDFEGNGLINVGASETYYLSSLKTSIMDVDDGTRAGDLTTHYRGKKGVIVPMLVFIPFAIIPYGSRTGIERKACSALARRLAFAIKGGVSGWPAEYLHEMPAPIWDETAEETAIAETASTH